MAMTMYEDSDPLEGMSEEEIQKLMELGVIPKQQDALAQQLAQATAVRNSPGPQGRDSGRVYTAASPLEHIAHVAQSIKAGKDMERIGKQQQASMEDQVRGRSQFLKMMYGKKPHLDSIEYDPQTAQMPNLSF